MKTETVVGITVGLLTAAAVVAGILLGGIEVNVSPGRVRLSTRSLQSYYEDKILGDLYWENSDGSVVVKVIKTYPGLGEVMYSKFSTKTGRYIDTCTMSYSRFLGVYGVATREYNY